MAKAPACSALANPTPVRNGPFWLAFGSIVLAGYTVTLSLANNLSFGDAIAGGAANAVPTVILGAAILHLITGRLVHRPWPVQIAGHLLAAGVFAFGAYWCVLVTLGLIHGESLTAFAVRPFPARAMAWQLLENMTTYAVLAVMAYLRTSPVARAITEASRAGNDAPTTRMSRYFIRKGDEIIPVPTERIVSITGADDYAEVATLAGRHLVRMTLADFETTLDPTRFVRVHRSRIVNIEYVTKAEPAGGGRLLFHLEDGDTVVASRSGSRLFRDRVL